MKACNRYSGFEKMQTEFLRICAVAVLCAIVGAVLGRVIGGMSVAIKLAGLCIVVGGAVAVLGAVMSSVENIGFDADVGRYASLMLKGLGISVLCKISADICRDCGEPTVASAVESAGKLTILLIALPLVSDVVSLATELLENI